MIILDQVVKLLVHFNMDMGMPGQIEIVVGDVIDPSGYDENNQGELMEKIKAAIEKNLDLEYGKLT